MGKEGRIGGKLYQGDDATDAMTIVGITNPFIFNNIYATQADPMYFLLSQPENFAGWGSIFLKLKPSTDVPAQMKRIGKVFKEFEPARPFDYYFLNDSFERLFRPVLFIGKLALLFGGLAIFISCLGLFGLAAFMAEQRTREIGIRKVLGASVSSISSLLSADFLKLVLLSLLIAIPLAAYIMYRWLMNYPYRIQLDAWIFLSAGALAILIALITVSTQAIKAAMANPVKSLRSE
jgi:ABC-type lipoprotein release transport system permease subunit